MHAAGRIPSFLAYNSQVSLTADYAPGKLRELLSSACNVPLEAALAICEEKGLVSEQVCTCVRACTIRVTYNVLLINTSSRAQIVVPMLRANPNGSDACL
jgi:hypothetical protein